jgi:ABC-type transport system substrate-binding protein
LIEASDREMDREKRRAMLKDLMRRFNEDALGLFFVNHVDIYGVSKRLKDFGQWNLAILYEKLCLEG